MSHSNIHNVTVSIASNCEQQENVAKARQRLTDILADVRFTDAIWTEPIHSKLPDMYLNQIAFGHTEMSLNVVQQKLKDAETDMGRSAADRQVGRVRIDLDLLQYDDTRLHLADWNRPYVRRLIGQCGLT